MRSHKQRKKESKQFGKWAFAIGAIVTAICVGYLAFFAPMHTVHSYDIKAEQVYDNDRINESVELNSLSEEERSLLHDAFKKSDRFLGSSEVTIERQEKLDTFDGWKVVEFQGVYILVAIDGPDTRETFSGWQPWAILVIGIFSLSTAIVGLKEYLWPSAY